MRTGPARRHMPAAGPCCDQCGPRLRRPGPCSGRGRGDSEALSTGQASPTRTPGRALLCYIAAAPAEPTPYVRAWCGSGRIVRRRRRRRTNAKRVAASHSHDNRKLRVRAAAHAVFTIAPAFVDPVPVGLVRIRGMPTHRVSVLIGRPTVCGRSVAESVASINDLANTLSVSHVRICRWDFLYRTRI